MAAAAATFNDHSDTVSEPPLSPFSCRSLLSDGTQTSDEPADLGAFTSVFRVMNQLQGFQQQPLIVDPRPESRGIISSSENDSDSSRWSHRIIDSYLEHNHNHHGAPYSPHPHSPVIISDREIDDDDDGNGNGQRDSDSSDTEGMFDNTLDDNVSSPPSLGVLDSTLGFLAAESAKLAAAFEERGTTTTSSVWKNNSDETKKRRRRKRRGTSKATSVLDQDEAPSVTVVPTPEASSSSSAEFSSPYKTGISLPDNESALSKPRDINSRRQPLSPHHSGFSRSSSHHHHHHQDLYISSSLPNLPRSLPSMVEPRLVRLRLLARKLRHHFPQNDMPLRQILIDDLPENSWIDPRGPEPQQGDPLVHVFIDHSNILVGFLNHMKRTPKGTKPHLFFPALLLILERGRAVSRRVLAASSPLYQSMESVKELGYGVHVYARVPDISTDTPSGTDNNNNNSPVSRSETSTSGSSLALGLKNVRPKKVPQSTIVTLGGNSSSGGSPTNVLQGRSTNIDPPPPPPPLSQSSSRGRNQGHGRSSSNPVSITSSMSSIGTTLPLPTLSSTTPALVPPPPRIRYREQGVDELLQLKLHQALLSPEADPLPPGSTIVLATGDGASGQFNEEGFLGAVKTALHKGWNVELYAWGRGISNVWWKVAEEEGSDKFKIWALDQYAGDLLEIVPTSS
ncbi:hypothetical protein Clacol_007156 [Clathrus columnatus]|uniref:Uncharacterized protein n=1 Tax=Clathrus columnatus TaxID=1419009 RepID=A0AAV5ALV8_9AGAM|nr:hypothetical protein Clacol_007156 [Clathrus columnatus]